MSLTLEVLEDVGEDFELRICNSNEEMQVECTRSLYPVELLQVLANVLTMIPEDTRRVACDIAITSAKGKGRALVRTH
jgi:hypothetical protein